MFKKILWFMVNAVICGLILKMGIVERGFAAFGGEWMAVIAIVVFQIIFAIDRQEEKKERI